MEFFVLYVFVMLEQIAKTLTVLGNWLVWPPVVISFVAAVIAGVMTVESRSDKEQQEARELRAIWCKALKWPVVSLVSVGVLLIIIGSLLPTPKQAAVIFGGGFAYQAVTSEKGQEVLGKVGGKVEHELDKILGIPDEQPKVESK